MSYLSGLGGCGCGCKSENGLSGCGCASSCACGCNRDRGFSLADWFVAGLVGYFLYGALFKRERETFPMVED